jgi:hypothetical protein
VLDNPLHSHIYTCCMNCVPLILTVYEKLTVADPLMGKLACHADPGVTLGARSKAMIAEHEQAQIAVKHSKLS